MDPELQQQAHDLWNRLVKIGTDPDVATTQVENWLKTQGPETGPLEAFARGGVQGATFEFGDEISGGLQALAALVPGGRSPGEAFEEGVESARAENRAARDAHPVLSTAGNLAGAVGTTLATLGTASALGIGAGAGATGGRVGLGRLAALGAAEGTVAGVGAGEGLGGRALGGAVGGTAGGILGAGLPVAGRLGGSAIRRGLDVSGFRPAGGGQSGVAGRVGERLGIGSVASRADEALAGKVPEGELLDEAREALAGSSRLSLLDVDPNVADLGRAARQIPGRARREIPEFVGSRVDEQGDKILNDALRLTGATDNPNVFELTEEIITRRARGAEEAYGAIRGQVVDNPAISGFLTRPAFRRAYNKAKSIAENAGESLPSLDEIVDEETGELLQPLTLGVLDQIKRGLDDVVSVGKRAGGDGGLGPQEISTIRSAKNEFIELIDDAVPGYAEARSAFAGESAMLDALEEGQRLFKMTAPEAERILADLGASEREMFVRGGLSALDDRISNVPLSNDLTKRRGTSTAPRDRRLLRLLFPDDEAFEQFEQTLTEEARIATTNRIVTGGSDTVDKATGLADFLGVSPFSIRGGVRAAVGDIESGMVRDASEALIPRLTATGGDALEILDRVTALRSRAGRQIAGLEAVTAGAPAAATASAVGGELLTAGAVGAGTGGAAGRPEKNDTFVPPGRSRSR